MVKPQSSGIETMSCTVHDHHQQSTNKASLSFCLFVFHYHFVLCLCLTLRQKDTTSQTRADELKAHTKEIWLYDSFINLLLQLLFPTAAVKTHTHWLTCKRHYSHLIQFKSFRKVVCIVDKNNIALPDQSLFWLHGSEWKFVWAVWHKALSDSCLPACVYVNTAYR